jgi:Toxin with endonuclease activity, of toxin-antitoxin system
MLIVNGWTIYAHPLFLDQLEKLAAAVETAQAKDPKGYHKSANAKLLKMLHTVAFERIPQDPTAARYRQGDTLGDNYRRQLQALVSREVRQWPLPTVLPLRLERQSYRLCLGQRRENRRIRCIRIDARQRQSAGQLG